MIEFKHEKVITTYYGISIKSSQRAMPEKLNVFFDGLDMDEDDWNEGQTAIRDYEGDFDGIQLWPNDNMIPAYEFIANKLGIDISELEGESIKITC